MCQPNSLYNLCVNVVVANCGKCLKFSKIRELPNNVLFDVYFEMFMEKRLCLLVLELNEVNILNRMLRVTHNRSKLLKAFQATLEHGSEITENILTNYNVQIFMDSPLSTDLIDTGLRIAGFFIEGGWYSFAVTLLIAVEGLCNTKGDQTCVLLKLLDCCSKRLRAESIFCMFKEAGDTLNTAECVIQKLQKRNALPNLASFYAIVSGLYFIRCEYDQAYEWTKKAIKTIKNDVSSRTKVNILRQASKTCVVKRRFKQAKLLINEAIAIAASFPNCDTQLLYSDILLDYGYYLLNHDCINESVSIYQKALTIRKQIFGNDNLLIAIANEDLAYALYVNEYSSGRFYAAKENAEEALRIMDKILPKEHLMLAFAMRVKALILEEIALDLRDANSTHRQDTLLFDSEKLHLKALNLSYTAFGEHNVQTAKHYGNLGRLYQTMMKYDVAETMHLKAIAIKEEIFGVNDYEVGLSIGHLASLYSYHMNRQLDAEKLYKRSIDISLQLFGPYYSGLEYDYRGLMHVYTELNDIDNLLHYTHLAREWRMLRDNHTLVAEQQKEPRPMTVVANEFFNLAKILV